MEQKTGRLFNIFAVALVFAAAASPDGFAQDLSGRVAAEKTFDLGFDGPDNGATFKTYKAVVN